MDSNGSFVMDWFVPSYLTLPYIVLAYRRYCIKTLDSKENGNSTEAVRKEPSLDWLFINGQQSRPERSQLHLTNLILSSLYTYHLRHTFPQLHSNKPLSFQRKQKTHKKQETTLSSKTQKQNQSKKKKNKSTHQQTPETTNYLPHAPPPPTSPPRLAIPPHSYNPSPRLFPYLSYK